MKKFALSLMMIALIGFTAGSASAQCDFDAKKSKGFSSGLIRTFAECPSTQVSSPNNASNTGLPSCSPVLAKALDDDPFDLPEYEYGPKGSCSVKVKNKVVNDCSLLKGSDGLPLGLAPGEPCYNNAIQVKCKGIVRDDGETKIDGVQDTGWVLSINAKASLNDSVGGDMTPTPLPVQFAMPAPRNGGFKAKVSSAELVAGLGPGASLPPCTAIATISIRLKSPAGGEAGKAGKAGIHNFAEMGNSGFKVEGFGFEL